MPFNLWTKFGNSGHSGIMWVIFLLVFYLCFSFRLRWVSLLIFVVSSITSTFVSLLLNPGPIEAPWATETLSKNRPFALKPVPWQLEGPQESLRFPKDPWGVSKARGVNPKSLLHMGPLGPLKPLVPLKLYWPLERLGSQKTIRAFVNTNNPWVTSLQ